MAAAARRSMEVTIAPTERPFHLNAMTWIRQVTRTDRQQKCWHALPRLEPRLSIATRISSHGYHKAPHPGSTRLTVRTMGTHITNSIETLTRAQYTPIVTENPLQLQEEAGLPEATRFRFLLLQRLTSPLALINMYLSSLHQMYRSTSIPTTLLTCNTSPTIPFWSPGAVTASLTGSLQPSKFPYPGRLARCPPSDRQMVPLHRSCNPLEVPHPACRTHHL